MKNTMFSRKYAAWAGSLLLLMVFVLPFVSFGKTNKIYVDDSASGTQNGSSSHPYKTISKALDQADGGDEVHVRAGHYKENITIGEDVKVFGAGRDKVTIEADDDDVPVVFMKDDAKIDGVKIRKGRNGVEVRKRSEASIINCIIEDNDRDGIRVQKHETFRDKDAVVIDNVIIRNNGKSGIYSEPHRLVITDSEIKDNDKDGVILNSGISAWIEGNNIKDNGGSGIKVTLDGANIWTKNNRIANNKREGVEVNSYGGSGRIDFQKGKIIENGRYAVARVVRGSASSAAMGGLTIGSSVEMWSNRSGNVSGIIRVN